MGRKKKQSNDPPVKFNPEQYDAWVAKRRRGGGVDFGCLKKYEGMTDVELARISFSTRGLLEILAVPDEQDVVRKAALFASLLRELETPGLTKKRMVRNNMVRNGGIGLPLPIRKPRVKVSDWWDDKEFFLDKLIDEVGLRVGRAVDREDVEQNPSYNLEAYYNRIAEKKARVWNSERGYPYPIPAWVMDKLFLDLGDRDDISPKTYTPFEGKAEGVFVKRGRYVKPRREV